MSQPAQVAEAHLVQAFAQVPWRPPTLRSERLLLRPLGPGDAEGHWRFARKVEVAEHVGWARQETLEDARAWLLRSVLPGYEAGWPYPLGLAFLEAPADLVGTVGLFWQDRAHHTMELAYVLDPAHWGQGLAVEASRCLLSWAFAHEPVWRVRCCWRPENPASGRVAIKLGFQVEGLQRGGWWKGKEVRDLWVSALLRPDWVGAPAWRPPAS